MGLSVLDQLVELLALEQIEVNLFRGQSQDLGWGTVFGGQVLGQALSAATQTVARERQVHSLHAYFMRPGAVDRPIIYEVDRIRDGGSFTTRRVVAIQNGEAIFNLAASFQVDEPGFEHQDPMPEAPPPEQVLTQQQLAASYADKLPPRLRAQALGERPIEIRPIDPSGDPVTPAPREPRRMYWMRAIGPLPAAQPEGETNQALHRCLLAYASDFSLLPTAMLPHGVTWLTPGMHVASLDHAMWFHQDVRADEWMLYVMDSPKAHGGRGLVRGSVFSHDGRLVASTTQEGLIRLRPPKPKPEAR